MRRWRPLVLVALALLLFNTGARAQEERVALLIGNLGYTTAVGRLKNPHKDVAKISAALKSISFDVMPPVLDKSREEILGAIFDFAGKLSSAGRKGVGLVYYSGHGIAVGGENMLIPVTMPETSEKHLSINAISIKMLLDTIRQHAPHATLFVHIDACRNNFGGSKGTKGFVPFDTGRTGTVIAFSTAAGATASDEGDDGGPYSNALAEEIVKEGKTDQEVFNGVRARVVAAVKDQIPWSNDGLVGARVVFNPARTPPVQPALDGGLTFAQRAEMTFWQSVSASRDPAVIRTYLKRFPEGTFAELAVALIDGIEKEARQASETAARQADLRQAEAARLEADAKRQEAERQAAAAETAKQKEVLRDAQQKLAAAQEAAKLADQKRREAEKAAQSAQALALDQRKEREEREKAERAAEEAWLKVHASNNARGIEEFLRTYSTSSLVEAARQKLAALATSEVKRDAGPAGQGPAPGEPPRYSIRTNLATASTMRTLAVAPGGRELAVAGDDGIIRLFAVPSFRLLRQFPEQGSSNSIKSIAYSGDGTVLIAGRKNGEIELWKSAAGAKDRTLSGGVGAVSAVGYYPAALNRYAVAAGPEGIEIWNMRTDKVAGRPGLHDGEIKSIAYTTKQTGDFVSGGADGQMVFYLPGNRQKPVSAHKGAVFGAAVSSQNDLVASAGADGLVKLWQFDNQQLVRTLSGHTRYVLSVAFDASGARLASGGADTVVRVWSAKDGRSLAELKGHFKDVEAVAFVSGEDQLVSISEDKTLRLWSLREGKLLLTIALYADGEVVAITETGKYFGTRSAAARMEIVESGRVRALTTAEVTNLRIEDFAAAR